MSEPWIWRPMCGGIDDAVAGMRVFESKEEMMQFVYERYVYKDYKKEDLVIKLYGSSKDNRIKWNKTYLICDAKTGYAAGGYCTNDWDKNWPINYIDFRNNIFNLPITEADILLGKVKVIKREEDK